MAKKKDEPKKHVGDLARVQEAKGDVDLYTEELKETLVEADSGSSGFNEERDIDSRLEGMDGKSATAKKKGGKKK